MISSQALNWMIVPILLLLCHVQKYVALPLGTYANNSTGALDTHVTLCIRYSHRLLLIYICISCIFSGLISITKYEAKLIVRTRMKRATAASSYSGK